MSDYSKPPSKRSRKKLRQRLEAESVSCVPFDRSGPASLECASNPEFLLPPFMDLSDFEATATSILGVPVSPLRTDECTPIIIKPSQSPQVYQSKEAQQGLHIGQVTVNTGSITPGPSFLSFHPDQHAFFDHGFENPATATEPEAILAFGSVPAQLQADNEVGFVNLIPSPNIQPDSVLNMLHQIAPDINDPDGDICAFLRRHSDDEEVMVSPDVHSSDDCIASHCAQAEPSCETDSNLPLFEGSPFTVHDSMVSILSYVQNAHLSGASTAHLLSLLEMLLPQPNYLPKTSHMFKKYFQNDLNEIQIFYFCSNCWKSRTCAQDICTDCRAPNRKVYYFISCSLQQQLQRLYSRPGFCDKLQYKFLRKKQKEENIEDIYDGLVYKSAEKGILSNPQNISLTWYSDGISVFECSTYSLWMCMFAINELPPKERHKIENVLIGGMWGGDGKPHPNIFLAPIYPQIKMLKEGVNLVSHGSETATKVYVCLLCGTCDVPAKATFMNMKGHSGYYSCPKCLIKGEKSVRSENVMVFPHQEILELRTEENYLECVQLGVKSKDGFKGVFGPTLLSFMFSGCFIAGMTVDVMHAVYMGLTKQLLRCWFDVKYKGQPFSLFEKIDRVNERLRGLKLPHFVQRLLIDVDKSLSFWKASLCRNFLLHIVRIVLKDIMPDNYSKNLCKLVEGVSLLNMSSISGDDLQRADKLLTEFCKEFELLYTVRQMSFNVHLLRHLRQCVTECGNLHYNTCFEFEDLNGQMVSLVHGTQYVMRQISSRLSIVTDLPLLIKSVKSSCAKDFCESLARKSKNFKLGPKICDNVYVVGDFYAYSNYEQSLNELLSTLDSKPIVRFFDRMYKDSVLYVSLSRDKGSRISYMCKYQYQNKLNHGRILTFVELTGEHVKHCAMIERSTDIPTGLFGYVEFFASGYRDLVSVTDLVYVSFCLQIDGHLYLSDPLNVFEFE